MTKTRFLKDILSVFYSNVFAIINGLLISIILSRVLGPEGFGIYVSIMVVPTIAVGFVQLGIRRSAIYHIGTKKFKEDNIVSTVLLILIITSILGIMISGISFYFLKDANFTKVLIIIVLLIIPFKLAIIYAGGIFLGKEQIKRSNILKWLPVSINLICVILFVWIMKINVLGALISILVSNSLVAYYALRLINKEYKIKLHFNYDIIRSLIKLGFVFAMSFLVMQLNYRIDILLLKELSTVNEVGYYSIGVSIAEQLWQLPFAVGIIVMSRSANATDQDAMNKVTAKLLRISFLIGIIVSFIIVLIAPFLVPLIWGVKFLPSVKIIQTILPGILIFIIFRILNSRLSGIGKPQIAVFVFIPALIINVILNFLWIPTYGAIGAAMATNVSYSLGAVIFLIVYSRIVKMSVIDIIKLRKSDFSFLSDIKSKLLRK